jgi:hypothetical protein
MHPTISTPAGGRLAKGRNFYQLIAVRATPVRRPRARAGMLVGRLLVQGRLRMLKNLLPAS